MDLTCLSCGVDWCEGECPAYKLERELALYKAYYHACQIQEGSRIRKAEEAIREFNRKGK